MAGLVCETFFLKLECSSVYSTPKHVVTLDFFMTRLSNNQLDVSLIGSTSSSHWVHEHKRKREDTIELGRKHFPQYSWTSERSVTDKLAHFAIKYVQNDCKWLSYDWVWPNIGFHNSLISRH